MTFNELKAHLESLSRPEYIDLANRAGVPYSTVAKLRTGPTKNPKSVTVEKLAAVIGKKRKSKQTA